MQIDRETLYQTTLDLCSSMLGLTVERVDECASASSLDEHIRASIKISGDWNATLDVLAPQALADHIASVMFDTDAADLDPAEVLDAFGEVSNIVGGNVKGVFDGECTLSLPCVGAGAASDVRGLDLNLAVALQCEGRPLIIILTETDAVTAA